MATFRIEVEGGRLIGRIHGKAGKYTATAPCPLCRTSLGAKGSGNSDDSPTANLVKKYDEHKKTCKGKKTK